MSSEVQVRHSVVVELLEPVPEDLLLGAAPSTPGARHVPPGWELEETLIRILTEIF